jgi:hypothetical protein
MFVIKLLQIREDKNPIAETDEEIVDWRVVSDAFVVDIKVSEAVFVLLVPDHVVDGAEAADSHLDDKDVEDLLLHSQLKLALLAPSSKGIHHDLRVMPGVRHKTINVLSVLQHAPSQNEIAKVNRAILAILVDDLP